MKKILIVLFSLFSVTIVNAQFKIIAEGNRFEEPEDGYTKILQFKKGNTLFFNITFKDGIYITPYSETHKEKPQVHIEEPIYGKLASKAPTTFIEGLYEISGDAVLFVSKVESRKTSLYRLIIDGNTGNLKSSDLLYTMDGIGFEKNYAIMMGMGGWMPCFYVKKRSFF